MKVASYKYDAWGKPVVITTSSVAYMNPLRYRGYVYDLETGWFYLNSRYYDPETGRFINADAPEILGLPNDNILSYNLFAYCNNNPVNFSDHSGHFGTPIQWACAIIGGIAGWYFGDYIARKMGYAPKGKGIWNATKYWAVRGGITIGGAVVGWFAGTALLKVMKSYLYANPTVLARLPSAARWFLGLGSFGNLINNAINNIVPNTITHIMQSKHAWVSIGANNWSKASKAIQFVLTHGYQAPYKDGNILFSAMYGGKIVQVNVRFINGVLRIVDAWVKR